MCPSVHLRALQPLPRWDACTSNAWGFFWEGEKNPRSFFREEKPQFPSCRGFLPQEPPGILPTGAVQCLGGVDEMISLQPLNSA